ncbi:PEGA domain-containing protein [Natrinema versiforme]|nr:PEGA domain-containing protein [Natrinema versiforme]
MVMALLLVSSAMVAGISGTALAQESDYSTAPSDTTTILENMDGSGTEDDPYVITDVYELQAVNANTSSHYVLGNDIDTNSTETWHPQENFTEQIGEYSGTDVGTYELTYAPISELTSVTDTDSGTELNASIVDAENGTIEVEESASAEIEIEYTTSEKIYKGFKPIEFSGSDVGVIDGNGHTINGLYINQPNEFGVGLVTTNDGQITSLNLKNVDITGGEVGAIAGKNAGEISSVSVTGEVTATGDYATAGSVAGVNTNTIKNSYSFASITSNIDAGGFTGLNDGGTVAHSYFAGDVTASDSGQIGPIVGDKAGSVIYTYYDSNVVNVDSDDAKGLTTDEMTGTSAADNMFLDFSSVWETITAEENYATNDGYPILTDNDREAQLVAQDLQVVTYILEVSTVDTDDNPLETTVTVDGQEQTGNTTSFTLEDGEYAIEASADGYSTVGKTVTIDGTDKTLELTLEEEPNGDEEVAGTGGSDGSGYGDIIDALLGAAPAIVVVVLLLVFVFFWPSGGSGGVEP